MARPNQEAIDTFISITRASEAVAISKLEEYAGDLNTAVNAHFSEGDWPTSTAVHVDDAMDIDDPVEVVPNDPLITHPREVREALIEIKNSNEPSGPSSNAPAGEGVSQTVQAHGPNSHETVVTNELDEDSTVQPLRPSAPAFDNLLDYGNDIEELLIRAAIEASKRDVEESSDPGPWHNMSHSEDAILEATVSNSLKTAEQEKAFLEQGSCAGASEVEASKPAEQHLVNMTASNGRLMEGSSSIQDEAENRNEQCLDRHRSREISYGSRESVNEVGVEASPPSSPGQQGIGSLPLNSGNVFPSDEWGGISSVEHDEAVMLEAAMFGGVPENGYRFPYAPHQFIRPEGSNPWHTPRPPSPSLAAQRLIREQQDDEYNTALQADREKELKAIQEAEACRLEEEAARKAALEEEQRKQECERQLAAKEASLPREPSSSEENAVNLLVRMPDGSRRGRLFLKSDKLQSLYDFIDIGRGVNPGTYRLVRPYPRRAFGEEESSSTLDELGLTNKQEALFLELI
ncbi:phosphatidylinositol glycan anchor biosynthesis class U protein-like [Hibiscus syriacus]|uniref:Phosphatidylinositol glycan anchor biosynthesis class U protein-like n=2 Tax=Hibiscus syriacus TaxID=106335 RepID=A0A6A3C115_HIBSY|nr:plant UBX domain-containing protein 8-like isoform X1 [Hibiscus syriacus]KAE8722514.1 phosphatidylinositol glycan anchor biosynthesis class U protein-like [Hibiscus syriacus]